MKTARRAGARRPEGAPWARRLKIGWWMLCLAMFAWGYALFGPGGAIPQDDQRMIVLALALISFPAGPVWLWALPSIRDALAAAGADLSLLPWYWEPVAAWFGVALIGHVQWFWLLPGVFRLRAGD